MTNHTIFERNTMDALENNPSAIKAYFWACDKRVPEPQAFDFAVEVLQLSETLPVLLTMAGKNHATCTDEITTDLLDFMLTRHKNWRIAS